MKFFVAMDSFKGTLSSHEASVAVKDAISKKYEKAQFDLSPIADGGEGTIDVLKDHYEAEKVEIDTVNPLGEPIIATCYGKDDLLILEVSSCIGLPLVAPKDRDPMKVSSYGVGLLIKNAIAKGSDTAQVRMSDIAWVYSTPESPINCGRMSMRGI